MLPRECCQSPSSMRSEWRSDSCKRKEWERNSSQVSRRLVPKDSQPNEVNEWWRKFKTCPDATEQYSRETQRHTNDLREWWILCYWRQIGNGRSKIQCFLNRAQETPVKYDILFQKNTDLNNVRLEVFTAVTMKNGVFCEVTPCGSRKNRRLGGTYRILHQGDSNRWTRNNTSCN
jgi:hypothetical protein